MNIADISTGAINAFGVGRQLRQDREQEQKTNRLNKLYQQAYGAEPSQQQGIISEAIGLDPQAGMSLDQSMRTLRDDRTKRLGVMAKALLSQPEEMRPQIYKSMQGELQSMGMQGLPAEYDETVASTAQQLAQVYDMTLPQQDNTPAAIRELQMLQANPQLRDLDMERRRAGWRPSVMDVPTGDGGKQQMIFDPASGTWSQPNYGGGQSARMPSDGGGAAMLDQAFFDAQEQVESGGNPNAVSPAGAFGPMQIMPHTARDPGFGMQPLRNGASPDENRKFGQEYMRRMAGKYGGNVRAGLAAYNWGPGNFDRMLASTGGDVEAAIARAPRETRDYVAKLTGGGGRSQSQPTGGLGYTPPPKAGGMTEYQRAQLQLQRDKLKASQAQREDKAKGAGAKGGGDAAASKADTAAAGLAQDAINFAAAYLGKTPDEVGKMTPDAIRKAMKAGSRTFTGPIMGRIPGAGAMFNSDLEAYSNSASGKQARLNNPSGPVTNADFDVARKSVWSAEKPAEVNADLVYQALTWKKRRKPSVAQPSPPVPSNGGFRILD